MAIKFRGGLRAYVNGSLLETKRSVLVEDIVGQPTKVTIELVNLDGKLEFDPRVQRELVDVVVAFQETGSPIAVVRGMITQILFGQSAGDQFSVVKFTITESSPPKEEEPSPEA